MIEGYVDDIGRVLIPFQIQASANASAKEIEVWIDTGFTGDLVISSEMIQDLGLRKTSLIEARLADGSISSYSVYRSWANWFGKIMRIEVIEGGPSIPLLGTRLLDDQLLTIDFNEKHVTIE